MKFTQSEIEVICEAIFDSPYCGYVRHGNARRALIEKGVLIALGRATPYVRYDAIGHLPDTIANSVQGSHPFAIEINGVWDALPLQDIKDLKGAAQPNQLPTNP